MTLLKRLSMVILLSVLLIAGCSNNLKENDFVYTVAINGYIYGLNDDEISKTSIEYRINETGIISCKYSECPDPNARIFYKIKDVPTKDAIAREVVLSEDEIIYKKCIKIR